MNPQERLFAAVGEADPRLIVRSEKRRRSRWPGYCLTAAACLVLVLTIRNVLPAWTGGDALPPGSQTPVHVEEPGISAGDSTGANAPDTFLPPQGSEIGTLRLLSYAPCSQEEGVDFLIYVNEEQFNICEDNGLYSIRNNDPLPEGFPVCGLDILHMPETAPEEAVREAEKTFPRLYGEDAAHPNANCLPGSLYYRSSEGTAWDSKQAELWFVDDGQGGTFALTARYFLEAEEGLGQCFRDMVSSFRVVSLNEVVPDWLRELYETTDRLFPALFSNDLAPVADLLAEDSAAEAYGADVWADVTVASVDYAPDSDQAPVSATVSVKHRLNQVEGDSFSYLTMELNREDGQWRLIWAGIEK